MKNSKISDLNRTDRRLPDPEKIALWFPWCEPGQISYEQQKIHAAQTDFELGFQIEAVEARLERQIQDREQARELWVGLPAQSLLTPYLEIRYLFEKLKSARILLPGDWIVDVGAAYGRMGLVVHYCYPEYRYLGMELCPERVKEAHRIYRLHGVPLEWMRHGDVNGQAIPPGRVFFVYDFGSLTAIKRWLQRVQERARECEVVIIARGRSIRDLIEKNHPWLTEIEAPLQWGQSGVYFSRKRS